MAGRLLASRCGCTASSRRHRHQREQQSGAGQRQQRLGGAIGHAAEPQQRQRRSRTGSARMVASARRPAAPGGMRCTAANASCSATRVAAKQHHGRRRPRQVLRAAPDRQAAAATARAAARPRRARLSRLRASAPAYGDDALEDLVHRTHAVHAGQAAGVAVEVDHRRGRVVVDAQPIGARPRGCRRRGPRPGRGRPGGGSAVRCPTSSCTATSTGWSRRPSSASSALAWARLRG